MRHRFKAGATLISINAPITRKVIGVSAISKYNTPAYIVESLWNGALLILPYDYVHEFHRAYNES